MLVNGAKTLLESTDSVYISFADLFMCLLVLQMFLINPPAPQTLAIEGANVSTDTSPQTPPLILFLHNDGRLVSWDNREQVLTLATIKEKVVNEKSNAVVLITEENLPIGTYRDAVIRLEPLGLAVGYAQERNP